ncbi:aromatic amino acid DMT transporter YddG [Pelosinus propionicus]|uniref:EamA-like transporter family protein n=1 Tax=Pelosinus propionicus DSM 13327 TaxID=1123291 RepID=A0A1I4MB75_9FIRM|nr:aromatic amino acid DMT transporter YddG [Pelosinus propionicus]SFM00187.1 EamA-like transporter family protein [Pelosinus propionicus DSM 13327]
MYKSARSNATFIGLIAIILWSTMVGLIHSVSELLGPIGGIAMIYTCASALLIVTFGIPKIKTFPWKYILIGGFLFVAYEISFALAIGYASNGTQAIEVNIINYLWPCLTILFAIIFNKQKSTLLIIPGLTLSLLGVCWVLGGEKGLDLSVMISNIKSNTFSYVSAFVGAFIWATYCTVTNKLAEGKNGITLFFILTAAVLWVKFFMSGGAALNLSMRAILYVLMTSCAVGFGYASWNFGILYGNVSILASASYFTPILSSLLASLLLNAPLSVSFWQGVLMVCLGSVLCWQATKDQPSKNKVCSS